MRVISYAFLGTSIGAIAAASACAQTSAAQSATPTPSTATGSGPTTGTSPQPGGALQEIVITAQKRSENLQRVPIAVTAASGAQLQTSGITSSMQLNMVAPGLNIRTTAGSFQPAIRGIGTSSNVVENPVALYIDGVYLPQQREGMRQLDDIAQVAVLKGPQGTLFGRNATGGVIQITTLAPSHDFSGMAQTELDNYLTTRSSVYVTGGLSDTVAASFSGSYAHQGNGWGDNLTTGNDTFRVKHDVSLRSKVLFEPGPNTSVTLIADYADSSALSNSYQPYHGLPLVFPGTGPLTSVYDTYAGHDGFNKFKGGGASLSVDQDLSFAKLVSITSYRKGVADYQFDNSSVPSPYFIVHSPHSPNEDYTQELQLVSPKSDTFNWVTGVFYFHNSNGSQPIDRFFSGPIYAPAPTSAAETITRATEKTESYAPFAQGTLQILPRTNITFGFRYTYERRSLHDASVVSILNNGSSVSKTTADASLTIRKPTYRASIDHRFSDSLMGYVSFNTGVKSGGFNIVSPANPAYLPEKLTDYEAGLKSELFGHRLRLNVAAFYYDYTNLQVIQFIGITQAVVNGPGARLYGLDADYELQIMPGLRASGGFEIEHSEFTNYPGAVFSTPRPGGGATIFAGDATGDRLPLAQKFTATTAIDYSMVAGRSSFDFNVTANYNGGYYFEADNFLRQNAYTALNASVKWTLPGGRLSLTAFGKNLFDNHVITQVTTQALGYPATYGSAPRTYGVMAQIKF